MIESADEHYAAEIAREYLAFSQQKGKYDQISTTAQLCLI